MLKDVALSLWRNPLPSLGLLLFAIFFGIAIAPEAPAKLLTNPNQWSVTGSDSSKVSIRNFPKQFRQLRLSTIEPDDSHLFRTWTPDRGIVPLQIASDAFQPSRYMSVIVTGASRTPQGLIKTYIECKETSDRIEIFRGDVNVNVSEAIVVTPPEWCAGEAQLIFKSNEQYVNAGIGAVYEISFLSYLKQSFIGRLPYFVVAFVIFSLVMFTGAAFATRFGWHHDSLPLALTSLAVTSITVFYLASIILTSGVAETWRWISIAIIAIVISSLLYSAGADARKKTVTALAPYARIWLYASITYFALLSLTYNGLGHWEPNYRFWPATWSSDNELPWIFAEAIRHGENLQGLFGGGWLPTDRPPLMSGALLLLHDAFGLLQINNDGNYLRGPAYNAATITLNALWAPAIWWVLSNLARGLDERGRSLILLFIACLPFVLINTVYGWPKAFGAAFALISFGLAWQSRSTEPNTSNNSTLMLFFVTGAFSLLAHMSGALFLAPLGLLILIWNLRRNTLSVFIGSGIALALLASWGVYKLAVLPSADPVTKYALTGDYGFGQPELSIWHMLLERYRELDIWQWLEIKRVMLLETFLPLHHPIAQIGLNADSGAGTIDKLRAWDFMLLSKGNVSVLLFPILAAWAAAKAYATRQRNVLQQVQPFAVLAAVSVAAWLLVVILFLVPPVLIVWPQAAVFGLALGGSTVVYNRYPFIFFTTLLATITYTGVVWILSPLRLALAIDIGAAATLMIILGIAILPRPIRRLADSKAQQSKNITNFFPLS